MALHLARRGASSTAARAMARRAFSSEASDAAGAMTLNFNLPYETIYSGAKIQSVIVPGAAGEYGVTADHTPIVAQLKPGVLQILHGDGNEAEKFFVPGGFSLTHANSVTDITCPEAVKIDDIDSSAVVSGFEQAKSSYAGAESGSVAQAEAQIDMEVYRAMAAAVGANVN